MSSERARLLGAEALGTFALVLFGCGAIVVDAEGGELGLVVMAMVFAFADVSGAHINPAVTLALAARRRFPWAAVPGYWGAQVTGASLVGGPISGASLNPARSLGPALVSGELDSLWIYLTAPLVGGLLGALVYDVLRSRATT